MDLMKWLNSLDELLYEVMSWMIFFPITLWKTATKPVSMMDYAEDQLLLPVEAQYAEALSPPLFLAIALLASSGLATVLGERDELVAGQHGLSALVKDSAGALALRILVFAIFPLVTATLTVIARREPVARPTLRGPFYAQCYPAAIFALFLSLGVDLVALPKADPRVQIGGLALVVAALAYYMATQTRWFATRLHLGYLRATGIALTSIVGGWIVLIAVGYLFAV